MTLHDLLGRRATLAVKRIGSPGAFLALDEPAPDDPDAILLPGPELPQGISVGDVFDVFVYRDSEDRPVATVAQPRVMLDQVAFLDVKAIAPFGAFVDWGLPKELLVPMAEQTRPLRVGDRCAVGLFVDSSGRLAGTMRVAERLSSRGPFEVDEWVAGEAWRFQEGIGLFVILAKQFVGLLPESEPHSLAIGAAADFRVAHLHQDGKVELSLRGFAHEEMDRDAEHVRACLARAGAAPVHEKMDPDEVRRVFGLSKKAFKRALGRLLRERVVDVDQNGRVTLLDES